MLRSISYGQNYNEYYLLPINLLDQEIFSFLEKSNKQYMKINTFSLNIKKYENILKRIKQSESKTNTKKKYMQNINENIKIQTKYKLCIEIIKTINKSNNILAKK